jgi:hypothetical protein
MHVDGRARQANDGAERAVPVLLWKLSRAFLVLGFHSSLVSSHGLTAHSTRQAQISMVLYGLTRVNLLVAYVRNVEARNPNYFWRCLVVV